MKKLTLVLALTAAACGSTSDGADEYRAAAPSRQNLTLAVPSASSSTSGALSSSHEALLGQTAEWYKATVGIAVTVNGGIGYVKALCEDIIAYPATTVTSDSATWGPFTPALAPTTYQFTITKSGGTYSYELKAKAKTADDSAYVKLLYGSHIPVAAHAGNGTFTVDWNAAQSLPNKPAQVGTAAYTYSRDVSNNVTIGTVFTQVKDDQTGLLMNDNYAYSSGATGGQLDFVTYKDVHGNGQIERGAVRSRWQTDGTGRSDLALSGGDLGSSTVTASECWDTNFAETYYQDSATYQPTQGTVGACAFSLASYSNL